MMPVQPTSSQTSRSPAAATLERVSATLAIAQGLASSGRDIDLNGFETAAGVLCAQVLDLPPDESALLLPALIALRARLTALSQTLVEPAS